MSAPAQEGHRSHNDPVRKRSGNPIDPLTGLKLAVSGRLVLMDGAFTVIPRGVIYIERGNIAAVTDAEAPVPTGFEGIPIV